MKFINFPIRYVPKKLSKKDKQKQINMLIKSKKLYKKDKYYTRKKISSYKTKKSNHLLNAYKIYNVKNIAPNKELSLKTGCKISLDSPRDFEQGLGLPQFYGQVSRRH